MRLRGRLSLPLVQDRRSNIERTENAATRFPAARRRTLTTLVLAAIVPLLLFGASVLFLGAEADRRTARREVSNVLERIVDHVTVALQKEVEVAEALAALPSLDKPDLERFYRTAQRIAPRRPLWETVSIAGVDGFQIMNILRELGQTLGPVADRAGFDEAIRTKRPVIGGIGPVGSVSGKRLVSISVPVIRDGEVRHVLIVGVSPIEIQGILMRADAPKDWTGAIADSKGEIVAQSYGDVTAGSLASETVLSAIARGAPGGEYIGTTPEGVAVDSLYRRLPATSGWTVHFEIPSATLDGPVSRSSVLLIVICGICILLAAGIAHFTARDLEERRREREELAALMLASSEERAAVAIEAAQLGTWRLDEESSSFSGSARTKELLDLGPARSGRHLVWNEQMFFEAAHPEDRARLDSAFKEAAHTGRHLDVEFRARSRDGGHRWIRLVGRSMPDPEGADGRGGPAILQGVLADVHVLRTSETERVLLLKRLGEVQEDEQRRIARELHDQVGQTLTGLSLGLKALEHEVASESLRTKVLWLESLTSEVSREIHRVAADLRPIALDDLGLTRALSALATELSRRHAVCFDVQAVGTVGRLPTNIENAAFRIVQEAFTNVLKHASATTASAIIETRNDEVRIVIEDDGCGIDPDRLAGAGEPGTVKWGAKLGLSSIGERLATLGGSFRMETAAGQGVSLFIAIPLDRGMAP